MTIAVGWDSQSEFIAFAGFNAGFVCLFVLESLLIILFFLLYTAGRNRGTAGNSIREKVLPIEACLGCRLPSISSERFLFDEDIPS